MTFYMSLLIRNKNMHHCNPYFNISIYGKYVRYLRNKRQRKPEELSRIENQETQATLGTRHRPNATKQKSTAQKTKNMRNMDPTKKWE